ncbi:MAG: NAD(+)/NADH kinase [Alphaproteobacteria bacterium]|nr:NAD(+)/NADH kinase [Alphaproteobacteria bacterium]
MHLHFIASAAPLAQKVAEAYRSLYGETSAENADVFVPLGGDGTMLAAMRLALRYGTPLFGENFGHLGYLMNPSYQKESLLERIKKAVTVTFHPLNITATLRNEPKEVQLCAFNEGVIRRMSTQSAHLQVRYIINGQEKGGSELKHCDGCIVATPLGSRAYWQAVGGRSIPWARPVLGIHSICSRAKLASRVNDNTEIVVKPIDPFHRPVTVSGDNQECKEPISSCRIALNHQKSVRLMFDPKILLAKQIAQHIR